MPARPDTLDFLATRRSRSYKTLTEPVPNRDQLAPLLDMAARSPDHGALVPYRFIVLERTALLRVAKLVPEAGARLDRAEADIDKQTKMYERGLLAVAVVSSPKPSAKIPVIEQTYAAGAVCLSLLNAALASGWGANWLSGWASHDAEFCAHAFGLEAHEKLAGLIFLGTQTQTPPERPRPDTRKITTWVQT